ncbi:gas vesicle protein GvpG [Marinobacter gelidimuriae]|uniref:gas vesicle protein GvpG n=1 Tax=Marinobacter gelidimuriae TaxID=2739064 RepID=UPI00036CC2E6|nr:gas vesicle protein GvpG [Marinobacter gelidimuriae]
MFLVDNILLAPFNGLFWMFKEVHKSAQQEIDGEADNVTHALSELYMQLETGELTDEQFAAEEKVLLDRLDEIWEREGGALDETEAMDESEGNEP